MFPGAKIVAVDDDVDHLNAIVAALRSLGIACLSYHYPDGRPDADTALAVLKLPSRYLKVAVSGNAPSSSELIR